MVSSEVEIDPLFDPQVVQDPYSYYRHLRETDPVHEVVGTGAYLVTRMDAIREAVARVDVFSSASGEFLHHGEWPAPGLRPAADGYSAAEQGGGGLAASDPPDHTRQRRVVGRKLSTATMRAMEPEFRALVDDVLHRVPADGRLEWMSQVAEPLPMVMVARILGLQDAMAPALKKQGYAMVERISGFVTEARIMELDDEQVGGLTAIIDAYTRAKDDPAAWAETMIGILARAVTDGELNDVEAMSILAVLVAAGGESTTSLTGTAVRILADRPDLQDQLRAEPTLIPAFVEEACRIEPPFRGHYRVVAKDTDLCGTALPAGAHLILMWSAANRDESAFDDPDEVRLDRPNPRNHVGFGWGIHLCVGAPLARVEAKVAVEELLALTTAFRIDPAAPALRYHPSLMVRRLTSLPLILQLAPGSVGEER